MLTEARRAAWPIALLFFGAIGEEACDENAPGISPMHVRRRGSGPITLTGKEFDTCFTEAELTALGVSPTPRKHIDVRMSTGNWDAAKVQGHLWHILLGEAMGYNSLYFETNDDAIDCCDSANIFPETDVFLENWNPYTDTLAANDQCADDCIIALVGFKGKEGIYFAESILDGDYARNTSGTSPVQMDFPASHWWNPQAVGNWRDPNLIAAVNSYTSHHLATLANVDMTYTGYPDGVPTKWFIPEWCKDPRLDPADQDASKDDCAEWIFYAYTYGPTYMQVIRNLGLRVYATWWQSRASDILKYVLSNQYGGFVYYWTPDPVLVQYGGSTHIIMKPYSSLCFANNTGDIDAGYGSVDCERATSDLHRIARSEIFNENPNLMTFFKRMYLPSNELEEIFMAKQSTDTSGHWHVESCTWLKANTATWLEWIANDPEPEIMRLAPGPIVAAIGYADLAISVILNCIMVSWIKKNSHLPLIKAVSPAFMVVSAMSGMMIGVSGVFYGWDAYEFGINLCWVRLAAMTFSNSVLFVSLFVKTLRVYKIFHGGSKGNLKVVVLTNKMLLQYLAVMLLPLLPLIIWHAVETNSMGFQLWEADDGLAFAHICPMTRSGGGLLAMTFIYAGITLGIAFLARNIPNDYNEVVHILYLCLFWLLLAAFTLFVWSQTDDITMRSLIACLFGICCGIIVEVSVLGPKFAMLIADKDKIQRNVDVSKVASKSSADGVGQSTFSKVGQVSEL